MFDAAHSEPGLVCRKIVKSYGSIEVLKSVDLTLRPGTVLGLIGENGAGKSTFNNIIAGVVAPSGGEMVLDGAPYAPQSPSDALARGVALIHQEIRLLPELSVAENLFLGRLPMRGGRVDRASMEEQSHAVLARLGMRIDPRRRVRGLSMARQQGIEIAKALLRDPRYIIFDEPTASLGEADAALIFEQIYRLREDGAGVIYVSHRLDEITTLADHVACFRDGNKVAEWHRMPVAKQDLINAMVGREFTFEHHAPQPSGDRIAMRVDGLGRDGAFGDISFTLRQGEILGFAGLVGAGRTDVVRAIAGADRADTGTIEVDGVKVHAVSPKAAIAAGIVMVPEDRKGLGLNLDRAAAANITLPWERTLQRFGMIRPSDVSEMGGAQRDRFDIRGRMGLPVGSMSGGNQQKVLLAKWLVREPKVFIVDEPTRGVDVGAKMAIYEIIRGLAASGIAVIVVSSELEEVLGLSHRVLVMSEGRQTGILDRKDATPESVMALAVGGKAVRPQLEPSA
ncbi:sugar ABC transporter ATP-binding protein [Thetidibacter halocola]|uniref:Sugar ABC transporter ATP-binding protein n=1 Tax=Thetidibacter halocola TaxID=2827239 RepID=A0A8J7W8E9_9RHOB|nr:sugar ABC transporter ATP-binding protein [Thetidibacter halocola]MBS0122812.1 sugar ABC transporter ATP-binding protein [Thetidibacter halocola]